MLKICAFSCIYIAKSGRLNFLCAYFFHQKLYVPIFEQERLYVLMRHVLKRKNESTLEKLRAFPQKIHKFSYVKPFFP